MSDLILVERHDRVALVRFNRPQALNALNLAVLDALNETLAPLDRDEGVGCFVLTGSDKAFAAGADVKEMQDRSAREMLAEDWFSAWERFARLRTPIVAAVSGFALGGGCEVVMMCDIVVASETATFGQPEIRLGVIPGMGGSQRLTRAIGKAKASDLILTGRMMDAAEAERCGLVARVVPADRLLDEALAVAGEVSRQSKLAAMMAKEAIGRAFETSLSEGLLFERRVFHALFATEDQKEGMRAFVGKRKPSFEGR